MTSEDRGFISQEFLSLRKALRKEMHADLVGTEERVVARIETRLAYEINQLAQNINISYQRIKNQMLKLERLLYSLIRIVVPGYEKVEPPTVDAEL